MPPKIKISEESILNAAVVITREKGIAGVNARELAKSLDCSIQPIFRSFQNMENLKKELYKKVEKIFNEHMEKGMMNHQIPFLGMGLAYIKFSKEETNLFKFLFMSNEIQGRSIFDMMKDEENQEIIQMVSQMTKLNLEKAEQLFVAMWLMTHGISSMIVTNDFQISEKQIVDLLTNSLLGLKYQLSLQEERK